MRAASRAGRVRTVQLIVGSMFILALVGLLASGFGRNPGEMRSVHIGRPAPDFTLLNLSGEPVQLSALHGQPVILNFWSEWCPGCKDEHMALLDAATRHPEVQFLGIIYQDHPDKIRRYLRAAGEAYPHLEDPGGETAFDYGVTGVPETYFIDAAGQVIHKEANPVSSLTLEGWIRVMTRGS